MNLTTNPRHVFEWALAALVKYGDEQRAAGYAEAARELEVAAAVRPAQDRAYMGPQAEAPDEGGAEELAVRGGLWLRAAKLRHELGDEAGRDGLIERVLQEAPDAPAAAEARELQQKWRR